MSMVIAVREGADHGLLIGLYIEAQPVKCELCVESYQILCTKDQRCHLAEHRSAARIIITAHPKHSDKVRPLSLQTALST